jgi:hypothetical protein
MLRRSLLPPYSRGKEHILVRVEFLTGVLLRIQVVWKVAQCLCVTEWLNKMKRPRGITMRLLFE